MQQHERPSIIWSAPFDMSGYGIAAHALGLGDDRGTIAIGRRADLVVWDVPNHEMVIHRFGSSHTRHVVKNGRLVYSANKS